MVQLQDEVVLLIAVVVLSGVRGVAQIVDVLGQVFENVVSLVPFAIEEVPANPGVCPVVRSGNGIGWDLEYVPRQRSRNFNPMAGCHGCEAWVDLIPEGSAQCIINRFQLDLLRDGTCTDSL